MVVRVVAPEGEPVPLRIVEVFANAGEGARDAAFEWVEVLNAGEDAVDLAGWQLSDNASTDVLPAVQIAAGERLVIAATSEAAGSFAGEGPERRVTLADVWLGNGLANGGNVVTLRDPVGRVVDAGEFITVR